MQIRMITPSDKMWNSVMEYGESCSWSAGKYLANDMKNNSFSGWERVIVSLENGDICRHHKVPIFSLKRRCNVESKSKMDIF